MATKTEGGKATTKTENSGSENTNYTPKHGVKQHNSKVEIAEGEVRIVSLRQSSNPNKIVIQFGEGVKSEESGQINVVAILNASDDKFTNPVRVRYHWQAVEKKDIFAISGITLEMVEAAEAAVDGFIEVNILNPKIKVGAKYHKLCIEQKDRLTPWDKYQAENPKATAKQFQPKNDMPVQYFAAKDDKGNYLPIFTQRRLSTEDTRKDEIIQSDARVEWEMIAAGMTLTEEVQGGFREGEGE